MSTRTPSGLRDVSHESPAVWAARRGGDMCHVYEVWDDRGRLAYVGIADDFERRWDQHLRSSWWLGEIRVWHVTVRTYPSRFHARMAEAAAINEQAPVYNTAHESTAYREYQRHNDDPEWIGFGLLATRRFIPARADGAVS